jgi:hypothetical protein
MANNVDYQDLINTYQKLLAEYNEAGKRYNTIGNVDYACAVLLLVAAAMCIKHDNYCFASIDLFIAALNTVIGKISKNCAKKSYISTMQIKKIISGLQILQKQQTK